MKYIILKINTDFEKDNSSFKLTNDIQEVFEYIKDKKFYAYKLDGEILPIDQIIKKKV